ncbi:MAG: metallophosphoesterase [Opitutales bacterium]|nr:metallophosphoesterase [Opitutales bacterium]
MEEQKRILIIGDLHAPKSFASVDALIERVRPDRIVLLGDYLDHFGDSPADAARMGAWLQVRLADPRYTFLLGNHDLPYLFPGQITCPGNTLDKALAFDGNLDVDAFLEVATLALWLDKKILLTHAGLSHRWVPEGLAVEALPVWLEREISCAWEDLKKSDGWPRHWIWRAGFARGGDQSIGGLLWCDYEDEFHPIPGVSQIFGHTPAREIRRRDAPDGTVNLCIDTCDPYGGGPHEALLIEGGDFRVVELSHPKDD